MKSLFIDNTEEMTLGILNQNWEFDKCEHYKDRQNASRIHFRLNNLLEEYQLGLDDIESVFVTSGPGSYTGVRVVEGIAQIMKWQGMDVFSFYQFEVPFISGIERGVWVSPAWKEELFVYSWDGEERTKKLVPLSEYKMTGEEYSHGEQCCGTPVRSVRNMMMEHTPIVFKYVQGRGKYLPPYYYRRVEQEFKKGGHH